MVKFFQFAPYSSTPQQRHAQRMNVGASFVSTGLSGALAGSTGNNIAPYLTIPAKFAQIAVSMYGLFNKATKPSEKIINAAQGVIEIAQLSLAIATLFTHHDCNDTQDSLCQSVLLFNLLYLGLTTGGFLSSELAKSSTTPVVSSPQPTDVRAEGMVHGV